MIYSKLIHEYIDSGLPSDSEFALFDELAKSTELRSEFNRQMKIQTLARQDMESITPPAQVTQSLFSSLGFDFPPKEEPQPEPAIAPVEQSWYAKLKKYTPMVLTALLSSGITSLLFISYFGDSISGNSYDIANINNGSKSAKSTHIAKTAVPVSLASEETSSNNRAAISNNGKAHRSGLFTLPKADKSTSLIDSRAALAENTSATNNSADENTVQLNTEKSGNFIEIGFVPTSTIAQQTQKETQERLNGNRFGIQSSAFSGFNLFGPGAAINANSFINPDYILSFNKINGKSTNEKTNLLSNNSIPENIELVGLYKIGEGSYLGLHLARESFGQQFNVEKNGLSVVQNQTPIVNWAGATYRFMPQIDLLSDKASVYAQATLGGSSIGPIGKTSMGAIINIIYGINLNISAEYGILLYNVGGKIYNSNRLGINYGLAYTF